MVPAALAPLLLPAQARPQALPGMADPIARADLLYYADQAEESFRLLIEHVAVHPDDYEAHWRVARAGVVIALGEDDHRKENRYLDPALWHARRAAELNPDGMDGVYWRGAAAGLRALNALPRYGIGLALEVYDDARAILEEDPLHAGAHNMLGKLHYEVMRRSRVERALARLFAGNEALDAASWDGAERHLTRAAELSPDHVLYQLDLGRLYEKRDQEAEAIAHLEQAVRLPPVHPMDPTLQQRAALLLDELRR